MTKPNGNNFDTRPDRPDPDSVQKNGTNRVSKVFLNPIEPLRKRFSSRKSGYEDEDDTEKTAEEIEKEEEKKKPPKLDDIVSTIDLHGVPELYQSETVASRIAWGIVLILAIFMLVCELHEVFIEYRDNPISTSYSIMAEPDGLRMPTVYLCPMTAIHEGQRKKVNVPAWWEAERNTSALFQASGLSEGDEGSILGQKKKIWDEIEVAANEADTGRDTGDCDLLLDGITTTPRPEYIPTDVEDYFMKVGYPLETLFRECSFNTDAYDCNEMVEEVFDRDYGKCFLVRSERFVQRLPGIGLSFALNLDTRKAYTKNPPLFDGLVMKIEYNFDMAGYRKLLLHPSQYTIVGLKATKYNLIKQSRPTGGSQQCRDADEGQAALKILESNFTLGVCRMDCMQAAILDECKCVLAMSRKYMKQHLFNDPDFNKDPYCSFSVMQDCAFPLINTAKDNPAFKDCYQKCEVPCEFWEFNAEMSSVKFPSDMFVNPTATGSKRKRKKREAEQKKKDAMEEYRRLKRTADTAASSKENKKRRRKRQADTTTAYTESVTASSTKSSASKSTAATTEGSDYYYDSNTASTTESSVNTTSKGSTTDGSSTESSASKVTGSTTEGSDYYNSYDSDTTSSTESSATKATGSTTEGSDYYGGGSDYYEDYEDEEGGDTSELDEAARRALIEACTEEGFQTQDWLDYIIVDIAYSNLQYTEITQENAISFTQTVSDVGGQIGLWLGASMISLIKIFIVTGPLAGIAACVGLRRKRMDSKKVGIVMTKVALMNRFREISMDIVEEERQKDGNQVTNGPDPGILVFAVENENAKF